MTRVLITGGTGFVGANLVRRLLADGHEVHLLVRAEHQPWRIEEIRADIALHPVALTDAEAVERLLLTVKPQRVFHLAVHGAYSWQTDAQQIIETNITGTVNLLQAAVKAGVESFVNTGSSSEYGFKDFAPPEDTFVEPNSAYAVAKVAGTHFCRLFAKQHDMHIPTLRLYSVYGPYEEPNRLIPKLITHGLAGGFPPLANPDIARDYVHVDDVVDAYFLAAEPGKTSEAGPVYNVGTGVQTSLADAVAVAKTVLAIAEEPEWGSMDNRGWDTTVWVANPEKIKRELGWQPRFDFERGFAETVHWFRNRAPQGIYTLPQPSGI